MGKALSGELYCPSDRSCYFLLSYKTDFSRALDIFYSNINVFPTKSIRDNIG